MFWPPDSPWAPWWRTDKKTAEAVCRLAKINKKDIIYDLGCGDGEMLVAAVKKYGANVVGIEIDPIRYLYVRLRVYFNKIGKKVKIKRKNFFKESLSNASVIFVYLVPKTLDKLKPKLLKELKPGTRIVSYKYEIDLKKIKEDKQNKLFLYKI
ncbi:MAG: 50S ribosomal protein L11 methyltransferase [Candidatus Levyibacteriota bacterium]